MWINTDASHTWMCYKAALTRRKRRNMHVCRWYIYIYIYTAVVKKVVMSKYI